MTTRGQNPEEEEEEDEEEDEVMVASIQLLTTQHLGKEWKRLIANLTFILMALLTVVHVYWNAHT